MATKQISRRAFLRGTAACLAAPMLFGGSCAVDDPIGPGGIIAANNGSDGLNYLTSFDMSQRLQWSLRLPWRGHGSAMHPVRGELVHVARRPGSAFVVVDMRTGALLQTVPSVAQRHFLGHAIYDPSGRYLYATENVFDDSNLPDLSPQDSVVGIYDVELGYQRVGELPCYGVGAHELLMHQGLLLVANGGIYTHPANDREKLNIDTMSPSLAIVDPTSGSLVNMYQLEDPKLSMRHLAIGLTGEIVVGMQYEGDADKVLPLMAILRDGLVPLAAPSAVYQGMKQYVGSVAIAGETIAASSSPGGRVECWHIDGRYLGGISAADISGLGTQEDMLVGSAGTGDLYIIDAESATTRSILHAMEHRWDNHLLGYVGNQK